MKTNYNQHLADLKSGLAKLDNIIKKPETSRQLEKALKLRDVQEARIDFFKRGYNFRNRELREQTKLNPELENNIEKASEEIKELEEQTELE